MEAFMKMEDSQGGVNFAEGVRASIRTREIHV
jgi:hypothetical protein